MPLKGGDPAMTIEEAMDRFDSIHKRLFEARAALAAEWRPDHPPPSLVMAAYAATVCQHISDLSTICRRTIFEAVEDIMTDGEDDAKDAVATSFLEGLQARASCGSFNFRDVADLLDPKSRDYCREWDKFTGVETPGL
jgi:hypothetical protein